MELLVFVLPFFRERFASFFGDVGDESGVSVRSVLYFFGHGLMDDGWCGAHLGILLERRSSSGLVSDTRYDVEVIFR